MPGLDTERKNETIRSPIIELKDYKFDSQHISPTPPITKKLNPIIQETVGKLERETTNVIDDKLHDTLQRIKLEAQLSEVEYGKLIMMIECNQYIGIGDELEKCLLTYSLYVFISRNDYTTLYELIHSEQLNPPFLPVTNEEPEKNLPLLTFPLTLTMTGIEMQDEIPAVFIFDHMLCCSCMIRMKKKWSKCFVTISTTAISIYTSLSAWKDQSDPIQFISFYKTMVSINCLYYHRV